MTTSEEYLARIAGAESTLEQLSNLIQSLRHGLWELICSGDSRLDPDDVIRILEQHGLPCPASLTEEN